MKTGSLKTVSKARILREALEKIREASAEKRLIAADIVDAARDPLHPAHGEFLWDDTAAAEKYRLCQARALIRRVYVLEDSGSKQPAYLSLMPDRERPRGGYRPVSEIVSSDALRAQLELTAKAELRSWTERYQILTSLVDSVARAAGIEPVKRKAKK